MVHNISLVLASNNSGKQKEMAALLSPFHINLVSQASLNIEEVDETGLSFVENALIKARHACSLSHLPALADDSGLVVPVLSGAPGLYSARYAGETANSPANIQKLLSEMSGFTGSDRSAYFVSVLVCLRHAKDPMPLICQGVWQGEILLKEQGKGGFGYDPVFWVPDEKCSAAELSLARKNELSHRGMALQQLLTTLPEFLCTPSLFAS